MARRCTCCIHPNAGDLDAALIGGASFRDVSTRYALSKAAVARHASDHLPARIASSRSLLAAVDHRDGGRRLATMTRGQFILEALGRLDAAHAQAVIDNDTRARIAAVDAQLRALHRLGIVGPDAGAGLVTASVVRDRAEEQAEALKAMATDFLGFTRTLREQMGHAPSGRLIETTADPDA